MADDVARARALHVLPARAGLRAAGGVVASPADHHVGVTGVRVDRDPPAAARRAVGHELPRVERPREAPGAMEDVGDRPRAVVAAVGEGAMPAAEAVGAPGDPVRRRDRAPHSRRAPAAAAAAPAPLVALEDRVPAAQPERRPGGRADDAVSAQAVAALEALVGARGAGPEDSV